MLQLLKTKVYSDTFAELSVNGVRTCTYSTLAIFFYHALMVNNRVYDKVVHIHY